MEHVITEASKLYEFVNGSTFLCIDFETSGLHYKRDYPIGIGLCNQKGSKYTPLFPYYHLDDFSPHVPIVSGSDLAEIIKPYLLGVPILGWNLKFDLHFLRRYLPTFPTFPVDVQSAYWILNEDGDLGLKDLASDITGIDFPDFKYWRFRTTQLINDTMRSMRKEWQDLQKQLGRLKKNTLEEAKLLYPTIKEAKSEQIPLEWVAPYCRKDVLLPVLFWFDYIRPQLKSENLLKYFYNIEMPFMRALFNMEERGVCVNPETLKQTHTELQANIADYESQIHTIIGEPVNINSYPQMRTILFDKMGYEPTGRVTKKAKDDALDADALKLLHIKYGHETNIFKLLIDFKKTKKIDSTYTVALIDEMVDGRIFAKINQNGTNTGRVSYQDPNLTNQPKKGQIRKAYVASEGYVLLKGDLNQAELRMIADRTGDPTIIQVYRIGGDIHAETGKRLGIEDRRINKVINFGTFYGIGPKALQDKYFFDSDITRELYLCDSDIKGFYKVYKGFNPWKKKVWEELREKGYVVSRLGRRRRIPDIYSSNWRERAFAEREAINFLIQGDVADLMRCAMIKNDVTLPNLGAYQLIQVHDEIVSESPLETYKETHQLIKNNFETVWMEFRVPILADVEVGWNWGETVDLEKFYV